MEYINKADIMRLYRDIHPLDYNMEAMKKQIDELPTLKIEFVLEGIYNGKEKHN